MNTQALWTARSPRERTLIIIAIAVIGVALWMVLAPAESKRAGMLSSAAARQQYKEGLARKVELEREVAALRPKVDTSTYKETSEKVIPIVLKSLHEQARLAGIRIREIKPLRPRQSGGVTKVTMTVRFTSEFGKAIPFLYNVEDPKGRLVVEKMNVAPSEAKSRDVDVEVQVALYTTGGMTKPVGGSKTG
jgi:type II secretory pathway component PulM